MKIIKQLIKLHKFLFMTAVLFTFLSVILNLYWNKFLAEMLDTLGNAALLHIKDRTKMLSAVPAMGVIINLLYTISEYISSYLASYTCEIFAHHMRMGYARYYLQNDIQMLSKLSVGEEQSAMQNELKSISDYMKENLFSLMKQFGASVGNLEEKLVLQKE